MIKYPLIFHTEAEFDYNQTFHWYEVQEPGLGNRFLQQMNEKLQQIIDAP